MAHLGPVYDYESLKKGPQTWAGGDRLRVNIGSVDRMGNMAYTNSPHHARVASLPRTGIETAAVRVVRSRALIADHMIYLGLSRLRLEA